MKRRLFGSYRNGSHGKVRRGRDGNAEDCRVSDWTGMAVMDRSRPESNRTVDGIGRAVGESRGKQWSVTDGIGEDLIGSNGP